MTEEPGEAALTAQRRAALADLQRLAELARPYVTDGEAPIAEAISRMPEPGRSEARAIADRIDLHAEKRSEIVARLREVEQATLQIVAAGKPQIRDGKVVTDPKTGMLVRDRAFDRQARSTLKKIRSELERLTGLPQDDDR